MLLPNPSLISLFSYVVHAEKFVWDTLYKKAISFVDRSKDVQWVNYLTTRLVDDFANHLKIFRITKNRLAKRNEEERGNSCLIS